MRGRFLAGAPLVLRRRTARAVVPVASTTVRADGTYTLRYTPTRRSGSYRLEVGAADGQARAVTVRERDVVLQAVGDINMGDG
ncbi:MAG: hypothetical protein ABW081_09210, partial [Solirubrobacteraceae bacterium]